MNKIANASRKNVQSIFVRDVVFTRFVKILSRGRVLGCGAGIGKSTLVQCTECRRSAYEQRISSMAPLHILKSIHDTLAYNCMSCKPDV